MFAATACRTNNGDIGELYGQWMLERLTIDGNPDNIECSDFSFSFQNNIVYVSHQTGHHEYVECFGTWQLEGDVLTLNFTHTDQYHPTGGIKYNPPAELHIPSRASTKMDVSILTDKKLKFGFTDANGNMYEYTLFKLR